MSIIGEFWEEKFEEYKQTRKEELKRAFEAGENLAWSQAGEYEGYPDNIEVDYKNFEEWFKNNSK